MSARWGRVHERILLVAYPEGADARKMAQVMGRTEAAVRSKVRALGLRRRGAPPRSRRRWTADEVERMAAMIADGMAREDIAAELGRTKYAIDKRVSRGYEHQ